MSCETSDMVGCGSRFAIINGMKCVVYILKCADGTLYTGSTIDLKKRLHKHNKLKCGAKYTKARRPVVLVYKENVKDVAEARRREAEIKRMTRDEKLVLIG